MIKFCYFLADDDSDCHPHDLEGGGVDLEYGCPETNGLSHLNSGPHPFNQSQVSGFYFLLEKVVDESPNLLCFICDCE